MRRGLSLRVETLEDRQLLTSAADVTWPSLSGLIRQAEQGKDTSRAAINKMVRALQTQLTNGPLADLKAGAVTEDGFVTDVQSLVASFDQNVDQQLLPRFPNVDEMLKLQGLRMVDTLSALNQVNLVGFSTSSEFVTSAEAAIESLTKGPIHSLDTTLKGFVSTTQTFESAYRVVSNNVSSITLDQASTTIQAQAEAYRSTMFAGLLITHTDYARQVSTAIDNLERTVIEIAAAGNETTAQADLNRALVTFDSAILDTSGLFGSTGYAGLANSQYGYLPNQVVPGRTASTLSDVGGGGTFGGTSTLTATVTAVGGSPVAGQTVNFMVGGAYAGTAVTDSSGVATLSNVPTLDPAGTTAGVVWASFAGSAAHRGSIGTGDLVVQQSGSTTALTSSANPSSAGAAVTFTATVTAGTGSSGTPTGSVVFKDGDTTLGTGTVNASGVATFSTSSLTVGTHSITAVYGGDSNFTASTSTALSQVVNPATTTALTSSVNPSVSGQSVTLTATVAPASGSGTPTGTVTFKEGNTTLGTGTLTAGVATFNTTALSVGTHSITAVYGGDTSFGSSTSTAVSQVVNKANATTTLTSGANPSVTGQSVTFTATVVAASPGGGTPAGTVTFKDGATTLGTGTLSASGVATFSTSTLSVGSHTITAEYGGNTNFNTSTSSTVTQTVNAASTTTGLTSSLNPSTVGQGVTFTATVSVTSPGGGTPTGTITFLDGATTLGTSPLNNRIATFSTTTLTSGSHSITAVYNPDTPISYSTSTSPAVTQTVS